MPKFMIPITQTHESFITMYGDRVKLGLSSLNQGKQAREVNIRTHSAEIHHIQPLVVRV